MEEKEKQIYSDDIERAKHVKVVEEMWKQKEAQKLKEREDKKKKPRK